MLCQCVVKTASFYSYFNDKASSFFHTNIFYEIIIKLVVYMLFISSKIMAIIMSNRRKMDGFSWLIQVVFQRENKIKIKT